jgi:hypothetical protein
MPKNPAHFLTATMYKPEFQRWQKIEKIVTRSDFHHYGFPLAAFVLESVILDNLTLLVVDFDRNPQNKAAFKLIFKSAKNAPALKS